MNTLRRLCELRMRSGCVPADQPPGAIGLAALESYVCHAISCSCVSRQHGLAQSHGDAPQKHWLQAVQGTCHSTPTGATGSDPDAASTGP